MKDEEDNDGTAGAGVVPGIAGDTAEVKIPGPAPPEAGADPSVRRHDPVTGFLAQVEDYLEEHGMAATTFGILAAGDPSLVPALRRGRVCRLVLADRVLQFMGREPVGPGFRREVEAYLEVTRTKPYLFGRMSMRNPTFLSELRRGVDMNLASVGKVRRWMDGNSSAAEREKIRALAAEGAGGAEGTEGTEGTEEMAGGNGEDWMDMTEVASLLGFPARTLHRYLEACGGPPCRRIGPRVLYRRVDVREWIEAHRIIPGGDVPGDGG